MNSEKQKGDIRKGRTKDAPGYSTTPVEFNGGIYWMFL